MLLTLLAATFAVPAAPDLEYVGYKRGDRARESFVFAVKDAGNGPGRVRRAPVLVDHYNGRTLRYREWILLEVDCGRSRLQPLAVKTYDANSTLLRERNLSGTPDGAAYTYQPGTPLAGAAEYICGRGRRPFSAGTTGAFYLPDP